MANPFERVAARMDAATVRKMGKTVVINGTEHIAVESHLLPEMGPVSGDGISLVFFTDYQPNRSDAVVFDGKDYMVTRWQRFNGKPQVFIE
ncbi:DNA breaking-rejoining protein [Candidatus Symbiopectobacterium sp. NZEC151]|uniref:DNA breaking-rejoining protein n=1 Tax=Candidatus Symbiopectobacterium sp. NZEC151 TaxID=2820470 RepID=UPI002227E886|nr:DNA breaking-rejoining protein [Candidatus Symbiopectobacterium sp. NZEC151]MCW2473419.1 DNA breaking-rejoining protein [Candidatus Symbiopectobacterium sp. NZEC151]